MKKGPYKYECYCGYEFTFSHSVYHTSPICPKCYRKWYYERDLSGKKRLFVQNGNFNSKAEMERSLNAYAKGIAEGDNLPDRPASKKNKESSRLRGNKDTDPHKANGPKDADRSVLRADKGLPRVAKPSHGKGKQVEEGRLAK